MKKIVALILSAVAALLTFSGCASKQPVKIVTMGEVNAASTVILQRDAKAGKTKNMYEFVTATTQQGVYAKLLEGEADIAIAPAYVAAAYYYKTKGKALLAANIGFGEYSLIENGNTVNNLSDLKGKEVYISGRVTDAEYVLKQVLKKNGISTDDVKITKVSDDYALVDAVKNGTAKIAVADTAVKATALAEVSGVRSVMSITAQWNDVTNSAGMIDGCIFVNEEFAEKNKGKLKKFLKEFESSLYVVTTDKDAAAKLCVEYKIFGTEEIAKTAIKNASFRYTSGKDMKEGFSKFVNALHTAGMKSLGQKAPGAAFYYGVEK